MQEEHFLALFEAAQSDDDRGLLLVSCADQPKLILGVMHRLLVDRRNPRAEQHLKKIGALSRQIGGAWLIIAAGLKLIESLDEFEGQRADKSEQVFAWIEPLVKAKALPPALIISALAPDKPITNQVRQRVLRILPDDLFVKCARGLSAPYDLVRERFLSVEATSANRAEWTSLWLDYARNKEDLDLLSRFAGDGTDFSDAALSHLSLERYISSNRPIAGMPLPDALTYLFERHLVNHYDAVLVIGRIERSSLELADKGLISQLKASVLNNYNSYHSLCYRVLIDWEDMPAADRIRYAENIKRASGEEDHHRMIERAIDYAINKGVWSKLDKTLSSYLAAHVVPETIARMIEPAQNRKLVHLDVGVERR